MNSMTFNKDIITNWQPHHEQVFDKQIIKLQHRIADSGLFTREALAKLIERCPKPDLLIELPTTDDINAPRIFGELGSASGKDAIAAVEKGGMWMNIRRVMTWEPAYRDLLNSVFDELEGRIPNFKTSRRNMGILISSPNLKVFYHSDIQGQTLWQIEGVKRLHIYPRSEAFIASRTIEELLLRDRDDMDYAEWYDDFATVIDLKPGEVLSWPLYAPHRVTNHDCLNISISMEHWTQAIWNSYAVHYGNGVFRRTLGLRNGSTKDHGLHVYPKAAAAFLWKKLGMQTKGDLVKDRVFRIDVNSPIGRSAI